MESSNSFFGTAVPSSHVISLWKRLIFHIFIGGLVILLTSQCIQSKKPPKCSTCKEIVDNFHAGLVATAKSNYGGGNTKWEEKSLGSYAFSEVRLVEILENLCEGKSKECHTLLEEHEDLLEHFWFKEFSQKKGTDFHQFFCIDNMKVCCPNNTFGKDCSPCPGGVKRPCGGNGRCDGEGTRDGSGTCKCSSGYKGDMCDECKNGFFEESNDGSDVVCLSCHISCKGECSEGGPKGCEECKDGWLANEEEGCQDINECLEDPCDDSHYCTNTQGSYSCFSCHVACISCTGSGPEKCNDCNEGFKKHDNGTCEDINECAINSELCTKENEECMNTDGSYECTCKFGFEYKDEQCVEIPTDKEGSESLEEDAEKGETKKEEL